MIRTRSLLMLAASATFCCSLAGAASPGEDSRAQDLAVDYDSQVVWFDYDPTIPLFLPQSELDSIALEDLQVLNGLRLSMIEAAMRAGEENPRKDAGRECFHEPGPVASPARERPTLEQWLLRSDLVFLGSVVDSVPGWSTLRHRPVRMVYVRVDEVLRDARSAVRIGGVVAFQSDDATIDLFGVEVCSKLPSGIDALKVGDDILFDGAPYGEGPLLLSPTLVLPVRDGEVIPQATPLIQPLEAPRSLANLKVRLRQGAGDE